MKFAFKNLSKIPAILLINVFLTSCNSLFYHPSKKIFFTPHNLGLDFEEVKIETSDHEKIFAWVMKAPEEKIKANILQFHGNAENQSSHFLSLEWLSRYGYRLITFDYRGYGLSSGEPNRRGLVDDGIAILEYICKRFSEPTILIGQSLGGAVAIPSLALLKKHCVNLLVIDSSFSSYQSIAASKIEQIPILKYLSYPLSFLVTDDLSPIDYISQLKVPILFIHSKNDPIIPYKEVLALYNSYIQDTRELWSFNKPGHIHILYGSEEKSRSEIVDYFSQALTYNKSEDQNQ